MPRLAPELAAGLAEIREQILADTELAGRIRSKFEIKNTTGYRLCAFLDAERPLEIFRRLVIGSEGTLAFVAEATFETVPVPARTTLSWLHFPSIAEATATVPALVASGASAVELMVAPALIVAAHNIPGAPQAWKELDPASAALLVEFGGEADGGARPGGGRCGRDRRRARAARSARLHPRRGDGRGLLAGPRGVARARRPAAPAGHRADRRGRVRAARADCRVRRRAPGAAGRARVPHRGRGPRLGGKPPLHAHAGLLEAGGRRPLRVVHGAPRRARAREVRRIAQGRARDRRQHGALRRARVGEEGDRADVAGEGARRPRRGARAGRRPQSRSRRPPAEPEDDPADRGDRRPPASSAGSASRSARAAT